MEAIIIWNTYMCIFRRIYVAILKLSQIFLSANIKSYVQVKLSTWYYY